MSHEYFGCSKRSGCPLYGSPGQVYLENGHYGTSWEQQPGGLSQSYGKIIQRNNNAKQRHGHQYDLSHDIDYHQDLHPDQLNNLYNDHQMTSIMTNTMTDTMTTTMRICNMYATQSKLKTCPKTPQTKLGTK